MRIADPAAAVSAMLTAPVTQIAVIRTRDTEASFPFLVMRPITRVETIRRLCEFRDLTHCAATGRRCEFAAIATSATQ